jgi:hypothetical protein
MTTPDKNEPELSHVMVRFVQEGNTCGTTDDVETLDVELEFQLSESDGPFFVIRTPGWSFDEPTDIAKLIRRVMQICSKPKEK